MAPDSRGSLPARQRRAAKAQEGPLSAEDVGRALLHFARLAASHARWGVTFMRENSTVPYPTDDRSMKVLATVTRALLEDSEREGKKAADNLISQLHCILTALLKEDEGDPEFADRVENRIRTLALDHLGIELSQPQVERLAMSREEIRARHRGSPSDAAAGAIVDAINEVSDASSLGRRIYDVNARAEQRPPVPGPLDRLVPLRDVRLYVNRVFEWAATAFNVPTLKLEQLRSPTRPEVLQAHAERLFKNHARRDLENARATAATLFAALLADTDSPPEPIPADSQEWWDSMRLASEPIRTRIAELDPSSRECMRKAMGDLLGHLFVDNAFTDGLNL